MVTETMPILAQQAHGEDPDVYNVRGSIIAAVSWAYAILTCWMLTQKTDSWSYHGCWSKSAKFIGVVEGSRVQKEADGSLLGLIPSKGKVCPPVASQCRPDLLSILEKATKLSLEEASKLGRPWIAPLAQAIFLSWALTLLQISWQVCEYWHILLDLWGKHRSTDQMGAYIDLVQFPEIQSEGENSSAVAKDCSPNFHKSNVKQKILMAILLGDPPGYMSSLSSKAKWFPDQISNSISSYMITTNMAVVLEEMLIPLWTLSKASVLDCSRIDISLALSASRSGTNGIYSEPNKRVLRFHIRSLSKFWQQLWICCTSSNHYVQQESIWSVRCSLLWHKQEPNWHPLRHGRRSLGYSGNFPTDFCSSRRTRQYELQSIMEIAILYDSHDTQSVKQFGRYRRFVTWCMPQNVFDEADSAEGAGSVYAGVLFMGFSRSSHSKQEVQPQSFAQAGVNDCASCNKCGFMISVFCC